MEPINGGAGTAQEVYREPWVAPGYEVLQTVVDKWAPLVLCSLRKGPKRYGELRRSIGGISQKMLTQTVRKLEQFGLVARRIEQTTPPAVEYALTSLGESLTIPLEGIFKWGETHLGEMAQMAGARGVQGGVAAPRSVAEGDKLRIPPGSWDAPKERATSARAITRPTGGSRATGPES